MASGSGRALGGTWRKRDAGDRPQGDKRVCPEKPASMGLGDKKGCFVPVPADIYYPYLFSYPLNNMGKWGQNKGFVPKAHGYWLRLPSFCPLICPLIPVLSPNGSTSGFRPGTDLSPRSCSVPSFVPSLLFCPRMALHRASGRGQVCPLIPVRPFGDKKDWQGMPASPSSRSAARPVRGTRARRPPPPRTGRAPAP